MFLAELSGSSGASTKTGLFLVDETLGLLTITREGDLFRGSLLSELSFSPRPEGSGLTNGSGLNERGQVAYGFRTEREYGIAIATPPDVNDLIPGDTDFDGDIDLSDLGTLATYYDQTGSAFGWVNGDFDNDNDVDLNDLGALATNYGGGSTQAYSDFANLIAIPEPGSAALLLSGLASLLYPRHQRNPRFQS